MPMYHVLLRCNKIVVKLLKCRQTLGALPPRLRKGAARHFFLIRVDRHILLLDLNVKEGTLFFLIGVQLLK
jgi:hypothetical protein